VLAPGQAGETSGTIQ
jgi:ribosome-associated protein